MRVHLTKDRNFLKRQKCLRNYKMLQGRIDSTGNYMHYIIDQMSKWVGVVESQGSNCKEI